MPTTLAPAESTEMEPATLEEQHDFNLAVWEKAIVDPELAKYPFRIESDRYGHFIMLPPASPEHGEGQSAISFRLHTLLPQGQVCVECPISTSQGVKAADVAWRSLERRGTQRGQTCLTQAPEICVEVLSPSNSRREMNEKRALYFEAGAEEVWFCERDGTMRFYRKGEPETALSASLLCPAFPLRLEL